MEQKPSPVTLFLAELKRRRVVQVGLLYLGTSVVVIEAADLIFPVLGISDFYYDVVVVLALVGFPVALVLAWLFDLTPGGVERTGHMTAAEIARVRPGRQRMTLVATLATVLVAGVVSTYAINQLRASRSTVAGDVSPAPTSTPGMDRRAEIGRDGTMLAILPFDDFSEGGAGETFALGMHDELMVQLGQVAEMRLVARASVQRWRHTELPLREVADSLGADLILSGSVTRTESQVRVTIEVVDAPSDTQLWSDVFVRPLDDIITLQGELTREIVDRLLVASGRTRENPDRRAARGGTTDRDARDRFIQAITIRSSGDPDRLDRIIPLLEEAVQIDSTFSRAWSALSDAYLRKSLVPSAGGAQFAEKAMTASRRALLLNGDDALALTTSAVLQHRVLRDLDLAEQEFRAALERDPDQSFTLVWYAILLVETGRSDAAEAAMREALRYSPGDLEIQTIAAQILILARRYDEAEALLLDVVARNPGSLDGYRALEDLANARGDLRAAIGYRMEQINRGPLDTGRSEDRRRLRELTQEDPANYWRYRLEKITAALDSGDPYSRAELATVRVAMGDLDGALDALESWIPADGGLMFLGSNPAFDPLRGDPRYQALLAR